MILTLNPI
jgi:hypothetical protein